MKGTVLLMLLIGAALGGGCRTITVKHEVKPIYATIDVNIKIQKELEEFFDFEQERDDDAVTTETKGATP